MIWKLLKHNISAWQLAAYAVATLAGVLIVMVAVQFYCDLGAALTGNGSQGVKLFEPRNMVISKRVGLGSTLSRSTPTFSQAEVDDLLRQPWVRGVEQFTAADFGVTASVAMGSRGLTSAMFFESVPDRLVDESVEGFEFDESRPEIPIVIPKDYLALYNFGFAATAGLPVVSEGVLSSIPLQITLSGNGRRDTLPARIVGFSSWLNTVAVPESFMNWARAIYGRDEDKRPARLIVEVSDPADPAVERYMDDEGYEVAGPGDDSARANRVLRLVSGSIAAVGGVITLLALFILVLSIHLLVQKNRRAISGLILLGYRPRAVAAVYYRMVLLINIGVYVLACAAMTGVSHLWGGALESLGAEASSPLTAFGAGLVLMALVTGVNLAVISRRVNSCR